MRIQRIHGINEKPPIHSPNTAETTQHADTITSSQSANLTPASEREERRIRIDTIHQIGQERDRTMYEYLIHLLDDHDTNIRFVAADALGELGDIRAIGPLKERCMDENCFVRVAVREALMKLSHQMHD